MPTLEVASSETVTYLVNEMLRNGVSSVLITENQKPIGTICEREILKEIVENHRDPKETHVRDLNYTPLIKLAGGESIIHALQVLRKEGMKRVGVVKNGRLVGMLTENLATKNEEIP